MLTTSLPPMIAGLSALAGRYDVLLCDVWGVIHDGAAAHPAACDALQRFRAGGGTVVLVSNAPRPGRAVAPQLAGYGVPDGAFDAIVASGDVSRAVLAARPGVRVFHIGPDRDLPLFEGLDARRVPLDEAELVLCTGPWNDEVETPEDYRALLQDVLARRLMMVCGNPDVVVERGGRLIYCAGAIADLYAAMDGEVLYAGKPHPPIYRQALAAAGRCAARRSIRRACWRSAIRCAPTLPARRRRGSTACSSWPASMPARSATPPPARARRRWRRCSRRRWCSRWRRCTIWRGEGRPLRAGNPIRRTACRCRPGWR